MNLRRLLPALMLLLVPATALASPLKVYVTSLVYDCAFATDDTVRVDIMFNSIDRDIDSVGMNLGFTEAELGFIRIERGDLTNAWTTLQVTPIGVGNLQIAASNASALPTGVSGQFARLVFVNKTCGFAHTVMVCPSVLTGDIAGAASQCGSVRVVPGNPGTITVESIVHGCGAALGDTIEVDVRVENAAQPVDAAGLEISFDPGVFEYVGFKPGDLTAAWPFFDAALIVNRVRVGGFTDTPIPGGGSGVFVTLRFVADCCGSSVNRQLCSTALVDDFAIMNTACGTFQCVPLKTQTSSWGYIKSIYR